MDIGTRIKELRREHGYTMEDLGRMIGVQKATIQKYESGQISGIPSDKIMMLANLLDVDPAYIMGWQTVRKLSDQSVSGQPSQERNMLLSLAQRIPESKAHMAIQIFQSILEDAHK